jgi:hypothetical protein
MTDMDRFYIPTSDTTDWRALLVEPEKQWKPGFSAYELATAWEAASGFPISVAEVLRTAPAGVFNGLSFLLGLVEHEVPLPGGRTASQTDLWVLAKTGNGETVSLAVEGKVDEKFDDLVTEWLARDGGPSEGKRQRLDYLCSLIDLDPNAALSLRYQLVHRTAAALIEAERFGARHAVMLVHSFSTADSWFDDYAAFAIALRAEARPAVNRIVDVGARGGIQLYLGWVKDSASTAS